MIKKLSLAIAIILVIQITFVCADTSNQGQEENNPLIDVNIQSGLELAKQGNYEGAIESFDKSIANNPNNYYAYYFKAQLLIATGKKNEAINALKMSIEADKKSDTPIGIIEYANALSAFDSIRDSDIFKNNNVIGNSAGNLDNCGYASIQNGWVYYYNLQNGGITRIDNNGNKIRLMDGNATHLNIVGGWIYYYELLGGLKRIKTDGSEPATLVEDSISSVNVIGDWIYYSGGDYKSECIFRMNTDGTNKSVICKGDGEDLNIIGNTIYFIDIRDKNKIYKVGVDGKGKAKIIEDNAMSLNIVNNRIYYINSKDNGVYSTDLNGKNKVKIKNIKANFINIANGLIYFSNMSDKGKLYKSKLDGSGLIKLNNYDSVLFSVVGDWVYYVNSSDNMSYRMKIDGTQNTLVN